MGSRELACERDLEHRNHGLASFDVVDEREATRLVICRKHFVLGFRSVLKCVCGKYFARSSIERTDGAEAYRPGVETPPMKTLILASLLALTAVSAVVAPAAAGARSRSYPATSAAKLTNETTRPQVLDLGPRFIFRLQQKAPRGSLRRTFAGGNQKIEGCDKPHSATPQLPS